MPVEEVLIRSAASSNDFLALRAEPWDKHPDEYYEGPDVVVELFVGGLRAVAILPAYIADAELLAPFFHEIDRDWRGWSGVKTAGMPDQNWLSISAVHDGRGHVQLTVSLSPSWPDPAPEWFVRGTLPIDVGSAASIASELDRWAAVVWPPERRWRPA